jgi:preprotein translocase subunit YajC
MERQPEEKPTQSEMQFPTKRAEWAKQGDTVVSIGGMRGEVLRVIERQLPVAVVRWENGHQGRISITNIQRENLMTEQDIQRAVERARGRG